MKKMPTGEPFNPLQAWVDNSSAAWQRKRAETGMTLGGLILMLRDLDPARAIVGIGDAASYRGYYVDLAFEPSDEPRTVAGLLYACVNDCMGQVFQGYKGGEFMMGATTPVWIARWGDGGERLIGLNTESDPITPITAPDDV